MRCSEPRPSEGEKKSGCWQAKACPTTATRVPVMVGHAFAGIVLFALAAAGLAIPAEAPPAGPAFTDVGAQAGIRFVHNSGRAGKKYLPETMGSGCAFFDAD